MTLLDGYDTMLKFVYDIASKISFQSESQIDLVIFNEIKKQSRFEIPIFVLGFDSIAAKGFKNLPKVQ